LSLAAAAGAAAATRGPSRVAADEEKTAKKESQEALASQKVRWLADKFIEWQTPYPARPMSASGGSVWRL